MPIKLSTTIRKIENISNITNRALLTDFQKYLKSNGVSDSHQNNNLKAVTAFAHFLGTSLREEERKYEDNMRSIREEMNQQFAQIRKYTINNNTTTDMP